MANAQAAIQSIPIRVEGLSRPTRVEGPKDDRLPVEEFFRDIGYVTLKLTNGCNLKCSYCNVEADHPSTPRMSIATYRRAAELLIENSHAPFVGLEFHGGEPLLLADSWFVEAVSIARDLAGRHGKRVEHPMQTNGTRLTSERIDLLTGLGVRIGLSVDGPPAINDVFRQAGKMVDKAIRRLNEKRVGFSAILVLSKANYARMTEVMDYFAEAGLRNFMINVVQPQGAGRQSELLNADELFLAFRSVFDHMLKTGVSVSEADTMRFVNRMVLGRLSPAPLSCWEHQCQAGRSYVAMNHAGDLYACGTDMSQHRLGSIFADLSREHVKLTLAKLHRKDPWYTRCFDCAAIKICALNCPTTDYNDPGFRNDACDFTKQVYAFLEAHPDEVNSLHRMANQGRHARPIL